MKSFIIAVLLSFPCYLFGQELNATVTINFEKLPVEYKEKLSDFARVVEDYLNNNHYTGESWEYPRIKCNLNIFFASASDETHYSAQVNVSSVRSINNTKNSSLMLNIVDNNWEFIYERGQSLYMDQNFDPLTDFLDYYAYIILGLDFDSYNQLGGSPFFNEAHKLVLLASSLGSNYRGWDKTSASFTRRGLVDDLVNEKYRKFREDYFNYHYNGLDIFNERKKDAQENIVRLIKNLEELRKKQDVGGTLLKTFFDAKSGEIVNYLKDYPDKSIFVSLKRVDPPHSSRYDESMEQ